MAGHLLLLLLLLEQGWQSSLLDRTRRRMNVGCQSRGKRQNYARDTHTHDSQMHTQTHCAMRMGCASTARPDQPKLSQL